MCPQVGSLYSQGLYGSSKQQNLGLLCSGGSVSVTVLFSLTWLAIFYSLVTLLHSHCNQSSNYIVGFQAQDSVVHSETSCLQPKYENIICDTRVP
jgi:hypothetical protein